MAVVHRRFAVGLLVILKPPRPLEVGPSKGEALLCVVPLMGCPLNPVLQGGRLLAKLVEVLLRATLPAWSGGRRRPRGHAPSAPDERSDPKGPPPQRGCPKHSREALIMLAFFSRSLSAAVDFWRSLPARSTKVNLDGRTLSIPSLDESSLLIVRLNIVWERDEMRFMLVAATRCPSIPARRTSSASSAVRTSRSVNPSTFTLPSHLRTGRPQSSSTHPPPNRFPTLSWTGGARRSGEKSGEKGKPGKPPPKAKQRDSTSILKRMLDNSPSPAAPRPSSAAEEEEPIASTSDSSSDESSSRESSQRRSPRPRGLRPASRPPAPGGGDEGDRGAPPPPPPPPETSDEPMSEQPIPPSDPPSPSRLLILLRIRRSFARPLGGEKQPRRPGDASLRLPPLRRPLSSSRQRAPSLPGDAGAVVAAEVVVSRETRPTAYPSPSL
ncbi:LOW QUALITY PROTEIN: hypothetical protein ACHAWF_005105 [Thalassiosira exigua]